jgi:hypothetical protein
MTDDSRVRNGNVALISGLGSNHGRHLEEGTMVRRGFNRMPLALRFALVVAIVFVVIFAQHVIHPAPG